MAHGSSSLPIRTEHGSLAKGCRLSYASAAKIGLKMTPNSLFRRLGIEVPLAKTQLLHGDHGDHVIAFYRKESLLIDDYNKGNDSQGSH